MTHAREAQPDAILKAALFAAGRHRNQRRKDAGSSPYINHPLAVAEILTRHGVNDSVTLQAALLHDTIEDTETRPDELEATFGADVLSVVLEVTDDKQLDKKERKRRQIEKAPRLSDRAKLVKIGDKICNVNDVAANPPANWPLEGRIEYLDWTEQVVRGCRGVHELLEAHYDQALVGARQALEAVEGTKAGESAPDVKPFTDAIGDKQLATALFGDKHEITWLRNAEWEYTRMTLRRDGTMSWKDEDKYDHDTTLFTGTYSLSGTEADFTVVAEGESEAYYDANKATESSHVERGAIREFASSRFTGPGFAVTRE